jgi:hypothetical protein
MIKPLNYKGKLLNAVQWNGVNMQEVSAFVGNKLMHPHLCMGFVYLYVLTPDGICQVNEEDYIGKDKEGNCYAISQKELE